MNRDMALAEWCRSVKSLGASEALLRSGYREDSVSRSYYAILHAAKSALFVHDIVCWRINRLKNIQTVA